MKLECQAQHLKKEDKILIEMDEKFFFEKFRRFFLCSLLKATIVHISTSFYYSFHVYIYGASSRFEIFFIKIACMILIHSLMTASPPPVNLRGILSHLQRFQDEVYEGFRSLEKTPDHFTSIILS